MIKEFLFITLFFISNTQASMQINLTHKEKDFLKQHPTITLGTGDTWAPYSMKDKSGNTIGYDNDILTKINRATGANFVQVLGDWSQMQEQAKKHKLDGLSTLGIYEERKEWFNFSKIYISLQKMVLVKRRNPLNIKSNKDLDSKTIVVHKGNMVDANMAKEFRNSKIIYADTVKEMLEQVISGKADATFGNGSTTYLLGKLGLPYLDFAYPLSDNLNLAFAVRKDWPEAISILNKGLDTISNFEKLKLKQKWFGASNNQKNKLLFTQKENNYLKNKKQITMCIDPDWMPFEKLDKGKHIGMVSDYFKIFQKDISIPIKIIKTNSWNQSMQFAKNRKCDILSLAMETKERKKYMNFTIPYFITPVVLATKPHIAFINNFKQLTVEKIGIVKRYAFNEILKENYPNIKIVDIENIEDGLQKVVNNELFGVIDTLATIGYLFQTKFIGELKISGKFDNKWKLGIAVRNDDLLLLSIFNKSIKNLNEQTNQSILNKYIGIKYEKGFDYSLFWKIFGSIFILTIILLVRYWTISKYNQKIEKYLTMIDNNVLISSSDRNGDIIYISEALSKLTGYTKEELIGKNHNVFRHKDSLDSSYKDMWDTIKNGESWYGEIKNKNRDGSYYWASVTIKPDYNKEKTIKGYTAIRNDITDKKKLEKLTITDALTQIPNRRYLDGKYKSELDRAKRYDGKFSVIILDIDLFKDVNDAYGHQVGDNILIQVAKLLKQSIRNTDILGRWGGEEFMIISPQTDAEEAKNLALKLKDKIEYFDSICSK